MNLYEYKGRRRFWRISIRIWRVCCIRWWVWRGIPLQFLIILNQSESEDSDEDFDSDESDEDASDDGSGGDSENESGEDWDELERKAAKEDMRRQERDHDEGKKKRK